MLEFLVVSARVVAFALGAGVVLSTLMSALVTFVLPRPANVRIPRFVFLLTRNVIDFIAPPSQSFERRDRVLALQAPFSLLGLPAAWLILINSGFTAMYWALGLDIREALILSGSSIFTLGFERPTRLATYGLSFLEAAIGLGLVALLISYLPSIYAAFSRRETPVALLEAAAGSPPSAQELLLRAHRIGAMPRLDDLWLRWQEWFADIEESHTSLVALVFLRSPRPDRSWVTAAGVVMDAAALSTSVLDIPRSSDAQLCIRAGYVALRRISEFFAYPYDPNPKPDDPVSVRREEFDALYEVFVEKGLPVKADRDQAWRDYAGWRVNYDEVLLFLASIVVAPPAMWISDRTPPRRRVSLLTALHRQPPVPPRIRPR